VYAVVPLASLAQPRCQSFCQSTPTSVAKTSRCNTVWPTPNNPQRNPPAWFSEPPSDRLIELLFPFFFCDGGEIWLSRGRPLAAI